ncbi:mechanosensitive ion channel [bacterium]|nr:mechanosensitive ion channel [bacterium]
MLEALKDFILWNNTGYEYLKAILILIALLVLLKIFREIILAKLKKLAKKTKTDFDDVLINIFKAIKPPFYLLASLYISIRTLIVPEIAIKIINILFVIAIVYEIIRALEKMIDYSFQAQGKENTSVARTIKLFLKISLWSFGVILALSNLGVNISSLIAGLGIGGIAIALALQNILKDIFSSFSILIDKPFEVGDFIIVGKDMGTVEQIGIKTSRLRALDGQQLIITNSELTDARVQNFKRLEKRRSLFNLGIIYETDQKKLTEIPQLIENIIKNIKNTEFDRCHFKSFGDFSLNFEVSYYVNTQDYKEYLDVAEKINLAIIDKFKKEKIEFAYPTHVEYQK